MSTLHTVSQALLVLFVALAAIDGLYFHLWRFRLHAEPGSRLEHALHTMRALLFPAIFLTLFAQPSAGWLLWIGVAIVAVDALVEAADVWLERASRAPWGGLPPAEYLLHIVLTTVRTAALALTLAARPAAAWAPAWLPNLADPAPLATAIATQLVLPGAVLVAALHVWLLLPTRPRVRTAAAR